MDVTTTKKERNPWAVSSIIVAILTLIIAGIALYFQVPKSPELRITLEDSYTYLNRTASVPEDLKVMFSGEDVLDLKAAIFEVKNTGREVISTLRDTPTFNLTKPLILNFDDGLGTPSARVLSASIDSRIPPQLDLSLIKRGESQLELVFPLLNPKESFRFTVLLTKCGNVVPRFDQRLIVGGSIVYNDLTLKERNVFLSAETPEGRMLTGFLGIVFIGFTLFLLLYLFKEGYEYAMELFWDKKYKEEYDRKDKQGEEVLDGQCNHKLAEIIGNETTIKLDQRIPGLTSEVTVHDLVYDSIKSNLKYSDDFEKVIKEEIGKDEFPEKPITIYIGLTDFIASNIWVTIGAILCSIVAIHFLTMAL